jgi:PilZ domain-containing protein
MQTQKAHDRRKGQRVAVNFPVRVILQPDGQRSERDGLLLEASEWGVRIVLGSEVGMGETIEVIPREGPGFAVRGRVVWIAVFRARHENHIGIQLAQPQSVPSWKG